MTEPHTHQHLPSRVLVGSVRVAQQEVKSVDSEVRIGGWSYIQLSRSRHFLSTQRTEVGCPEPHVVEGENRLL